MFGGKFSKKRNTEDFIVESDSNSTDKKKKIKKGCLPAVIISVVILGIIGSCGSDGEESVALTETTTAVQESITQEVTTAPSTVAAVAVATTEEETTEAETTTKATTTEKETTTQKPTTTEKKTTTTKKETTTEKKTTTTKKSTTTKKVTTTKKSSNVATGTRYILNTDSSKFHYPSCHSAKQISAENYAEFNGTREEVMKKGYSPCGNCDP